MFLCNFSLRANCTKLTGTLPGCKHRMCACVQGSGQALLNVDIWMHIWHSHMKYIPPPIHTKKLEIPIRKLTSKISEKSIQNFRETSKGIPLFPFGMRSTELFLQFTPFLVSRRTKKHYFKVSSLLLGIVSLKESLKKSLPFLLRSQNERYFSCVPTAQGFLGTVLQDGSRLGENPGDSQVMW